MRRLETSRRPLRRRSTGTSRCPGPAYPGPKRVIRFVQEGNRAPLAASSLRPASPLEPRGQWQLWADPPGCSVVRPGLGEVT
jgi:hypothetical protein